MTTDRSLFLTEYQWNSPQFPVMCFTCQQRCQARGSRYYHLITKFLFTKGDALNSHECLCLDCYESFDKIVTEFLSKYSSQETTQEQLQSEIARLYSDFSNVSVADRKCDWIRNGIRIKLRSCCKRMLFTNADATDEQNDYHFMSNNVGSSNENNLVRRQHVKVSPDGKQVDLPESIHTLNTIPSLVVPTSTSQPISTLPVTQLPMMLRAQDLLSIFITQRELMIGQLQLSGGRVKHVDRYHRIDFECWNCWLERKNEFCLGWAMNGCIRKNKKTKKLSYMWTTFGEFCSPGCAFTFAAYYPDLFSDQTAGFTKLMFMRAYKYREDIIKALPYWRLPICTNSPLNNLNTTKTKTPLADSYKISETWRAGVIDKLRSPNPNKHRFADELSTVVILVDMKKFNMFMKEDANAVHSSNPLFWYNNFLKDFPQFTCMPDYAKEMKQRIVTKSGTSTANATRPAIEERKHSSLMKRFLKHQEQKMHPEIQRDMDDIFAESTPAQVTSTASSTMSTAPIPMSTPASATAPDPTKKKKDKSKQRVGFGVNSTIEPIMTADDFFGGIRNNVPKKQQKKTALDTASFFSS